MSSKDVVIVSSATCLPYRDWETKEKADAREDAKVTEAGFNVRRVENDTEEIIGLIESISENLPAAIVFENDIGSLLFEGYEVAKKNVLEKLRPVSESGVHILSMNYRKLSTEDADFIEALAGPSLFGNSGFGSAIVEHLANIKAE